MSSQTVKKLTVCEALKVKGKFQKCHLSHPLTSRDIKRRGKNGNDDQKFDLIIVGAGTSGSLLTYRLANRYQNAKILVLETGQDDARIDTDQVPGGLSAVQNPNPNNGDALDAWSQLIRPSGAFAATGEGAFTWQQNIVSSPDDLSFATPIQSARGATLGGTSAINVQIWNRGTKEGTYDRWEAATGDSNFGFSAMVNSYKQIENRTQETRFYGFPAEYWISGPGPQPPGQTLNSLMGTTGNMFLTSQIFPGYSSSAFDESVTEAPLPGRTSTFLIEQADVDPNNTAIEYGYYVPFTSYDQSDPNFPNINPYLPTDPGYTFTPLADPTNAKGPEYGGFGNFNSLFGPPGPGVGVAKSLTVRCYAANAYLYPILNNPVDFPNFTLKQRTYVTKLLFNPQNEKEVIGVEYVEGENGEGWQVAEIARSIRRDIPPYKGTLSDVDRSKCSVDAAVANQQNISYKQAFAKTDIWICAGVIDTPGILQRSGIGSREFLESLPTPVSCKVDLPGVGKNVKDSVFGLFVYATEVDLSSNLPFPFPAAISEEWSLSSFFGFADPTIPFLDPSLTASISGAAVKNFPVYRIKSNPSKAYSDSEIILANSPASTLAGSVLYQDILDYNVLVVSTKYNPDTIKPVYDRAKWGMWGDNDQYVYMNGSGIEYYDAVSSGTVAINSSNVFERPTYAPNMLSNEVDIDNLANVFINTLFPLYQRNASKRYGPRGLTTYAGVALGGSPTTVNLGAFNSLTGPFALKPIDGNITQAQYDTPGELVGYSIGFIDGTGAGQRAEITAWSGAPTYKATVPFWVFGPPDATSIYLLDPPGATPLDVVKFVDDNHRNFVRLTHPNGDQLFSIVQTITPTPLMPNITLTTTAGSTRIRINQADHGLSTGDMIKITGVQNPVDNIDPVHINDYHIIYKIDDHNYDIILFWNVTPNKGPGSGILLTGDGSGVMPHPAQNAAGTVNIFNQAGSININLLYFDHAKFRTWLKTHYASGWHGCMSCRMGKPEDVDAVVDTRARVYDTIGLRICDASIFPTKPNCNIQAPCYAIAQKLFELISVEEYDQLL